jgi:hypothetical protein
VASITNTGLAVVLRSVFPSLISLIQQHTYIRENASSP